VKDDHIPLLYFRGVWIYPLHTARLGGAFTLVINTPTIKAIASGTCRASPTLCRGARTEVNTAAISFPFLNAVFVRLHLIRGRRVSFPGRTGSHASCGSPSSVSLLSADASDCFSSDSAHGWRAKIRFFNEFSVLAPITCRSSASAAGNA
jgi:hypothetical protein